MAVDFTQEIQDLRTTMDSVRQVTDLGKLEATIADLEQQSAAPDLWDDQEKAQQVTSALSRAKAEHDRVTGMDSRVEDLEVLDVPARLPEGITGRDLSAGAYQASDADLPVTLRLAPSAHWVAEYYPVTSRETAGEDLLVTLPTSNEGFLRRLVLRLGGGAQVVAPESARAAVEGAAEQALSGYDAH